MIPFTHPMHKEGNDGFKIETDYKGRKFIRIYQEMESGSILKVYLAESDIRQIYAKLKEDY